MLRDLGELLGVSRHDHVAEDAARAGRRDRVRHPRMAVEWLDVLVLDALRAGPSRNQADDAGRPVAWHGSPLRAGKCTTRSLPPGMELSVIRRLLVERR